jgi:hypothetical protein
MGAIELQFGLYPGLHSVAGLADCKTISAQRLGNLLPNPDAQENGRKHEYLEKSDTYRLAALRHSS